MKEFNEPTIVELIDKAIEGAECFPFELSAEELSEPSIIETLNDKIGRCLV